MRAEEGHEAVAFQHAAIQADVHERYDVTHLEAAYPGFEAVEFSGSKRSGDERPDRGSADEVEMDARSFKTPQYANMRPAACGAAAQRQCDDRLAAGRHHGRTGGSVPAAGGAADGE